MFTVCLFLLGMFIPKPHYFVVLLLRRPGLKSIYNQILYIFKFHWTIATAVDQGEFGEKGCRMATRRCL